MYAFESFFEHVKRLLQLKQNSAKQIQKNVLFQTCWACHCHIKIDELFIFQLAKILHISDV